jgi:hypothetical protein
LNRFSVRAVGLFCIVAVAACSGGSNAQSGMPYVPSSQAVPAENSASPLVRQVGFIPFRAPNPVRRVCPQPSHPGEAECLALLRTDLPSATMPDGEPAAGFGPHDLQQAYDAPSATGGKGQTVAIVDAYGYPRAEQDLAHYRNVFKLPPCTTANRCLRILNGTGGSTLPPASPDWDYEQALDLDMVSAMCPKCKIVLLQASNSSETELFLADNIAAELGVDVVSNSFGGKESQASNTGDFPPGHTYVASAGDGGGGTLDGGGPLQPCSFSNVVCTGGTALTQSNGARGWSEVVWNDERMDECGTGTQPCGAAGSGCSNLVAKPSWQHDPLCHRRADADLAAVAAVSTPVAIFENGDWLSIGGTSVSSPLIAGMIALAGNGKSANVPERIWGHGGGSLLNDVVEGTNVYEPVTGACASAVAYICTARPGYDGPTGWGSPNGVGAL